MTSNANTGAGRPQNASPVAPPGAISRPVSPTEGRIPDAGAPQHHDPEAKELLQRYLSEIHSYRQLGNAALRDLEKRLEALSETEEQAMAEMMPHQASPLARSLASDAAVPVEKRADLTDRLRELSAYLHADLSRQQGAQPEDGQRAEPRAQQAAPTQHPAADAGPDMAHPPRAPRLVPSHKLTPNAPILDRAWFEDRFATMRASIDALAEQIPTQRLDALEGQFHQLMEKLDARSTDRSMAAVEAGLKKLAAYLEDNKQWNSAQDARVRGVEERLDRLSGLVAQSHAALSATARGLEIVARGTGTKLAQETADIVARRLESRLDGIDPKQPIAELGGEVARLSVHTKQFARSTDERLKQLQHCLDESLDRLDDYDAEKTLPPRSGESSWLNRTEDDGLDDDYDGKMIAAARRAARLANGPARDLPENGEPVRYQIPYGEFLPEEERHNSRIGLIVAAVILLLASAAMLYLNLRDKGHPGSQASAWLYNLLSEREPEKPQIEPLTTASVHTQIVMPETGKSTEDRLESEAWLAAAASPLSPEAVPVVQASTDTEPAATQADESDDDRLSFKPKSESLRTAAVAGDAEAQFSIGENYLEGRNADQKLPVTERLSKAARWFRRAAEKGHAPSQYRLATLYELGQGAPKDQAQAMMWYSRAAENGHVKAMHNLAVLSITGSNRSANYLTAAKWFAEAAKHGLRDSEYNLGVLYERGLGVPKDPAIAYRWFSLAANQGDTKAVQKREQIAALLSPADKEQEDRATSAWSAEETDAAVNSNAPEPPVEQAHQTQPVIEPKTASAHLLKSSWSTEVSTVNTLVAEAQRALSRLGYAPGPVDGLVGPRTTAAIRAFEQKFGLPATGRITEALLAKLSVGTQS